MVKIKVGKLSSKRQRMNLPDRNEIEERKQICMSALLNRPWIDKEKNAEIYYWIKDQYFEIKDWFMRYTGYSIVMNRNFIKLEKVPAHAFPWMGFQEFREPLDYALFTYSLWYLENKTEGEQFLLTKLVIDIRQYMVEQGMDVNWGNYYHRLSMARALRKLKNLNIVRSVDGEEANWALKYEHHDVLYECTCYSRYILRSFPDELSSYTDMNQLKETMPYGTDSNEIEMKRRHELYRRFLLEPILLNHQWYGDPSYLQQEASFLIKNLKTMFGWEGSRYREGILLFETNSMSESETFPTQFALSDMAMLLLGEIRSMESNSEIGMKVELNGFLRLTKNEIERALIHLKARFGEFWTTEHKKMNSAVLAEEICDHLTEWGFGHWEDHMFFVLNGAGGRWKVQYGSTEQAD
ncbi:TIGR02678 family protein [Paenibacillus sp. 481]|uniref:TIGR02678 family protein n=1 Tax=Paenibacillus sp. 481 TaxID=2835869 RepID=UPI001E5008C6|nr:TIGR02678 family protein [Paenibacillus sp. 481]UHA72765.1 TIGR02678 family protein [Paenibacillus sp. 481]